MQDDTNFCAVRGRRADTKVTKELFINLVANSDVQARPKVEVMQVTREQRQTESNGVVETIA
ncbi:NMCC_0638 family (lipo)protein [Halopseudomonas formosensis]|uniref:NMCC_0638 family (lipo)protein n=1 Tax=Halopseudomonas formosensis TaxID=1002526 RepID=UPI0038B29CE2